VEPLRADRLQGRARAVQGRPPRGLVREFCDRLLGLRRTARCGLGVWGQPAVVAVAKEALAARRRDTGGTIWRIS
jgi:hypothetical protein